jgi:very-short-patch-repair endonuclease
MKLAVDVDGGVHRDQVREDKERQRALDEAGIRIVRLDVNQLHGDIPALLGTLIQSPSSDSEAPLHKDGEGLG